jgi:energy-coupling factor transporter transmembrane protein EcfT
MNSDLVIVDGVFTKSYSNSLMHWTKIIFIFQLLLFVYRVFYLDAYWLTYMIVFVICGIYIPLCGYKSAKKANHKYLRLFSTIQCFFSILTIFNVVNYVINTSLIEDACKKCAEQFKNSEECDFVFYDNNDVIITSENCEHLPSTEELAIYSFFMSGIVFSGCLTAFIALKITREEVVEAVLVNSVPDIEVDILEPVRLAQVVQQLPEVDTDALESIVEGCELE